MVIRVKPITFRARKREKEANRKWKELLCYMTLMDEQVIFVIIRPQGVISLCRGTVARPTLQQTTIFSGGAPLNKLLNTEKAFMAI